MKELLFPGAAVIFILWLSCNKNADPEPETVDYRKAVTGAYSGTVRELRIDPHFDTIFDTTYTHTLQVSLHPVWKNIVQVGNYLGTLSKTHELNSPPAYYPHGATTGAFRLTPATDSLEMEYVHAHSNNVSVYKFSGKR